MQALLAATDIERLCRDRPLMGIRAAVFEDVG
jgi:hypothetical protein